MYQARYPGTWVRLATVVVITALSSPLAWAQGNGCNSNDPGAPCFANVSDILQGRRQLLPVEDLVVTFFDSSSNAVNNLVLQTTDSSIGTQIPYFILNPATAVTTGVGRMFNLPRDVIFTITGPPGGINVRDQNPNGAVTQGFPFPRIPRAMTMADFTGDGYADVAVLAADSPGDTGGLLQIITANDVNNLDAGLFASDGIGPFLVNFTLPITIAAGDFNGDGKHEVAILQSFFDGGTETTQYVLNIYEVLTSEDGKIAPQALRQAASLTVDTHILFNPSMIRDFTLLAGDYDGVSSNATTGLPDDELVLTFLIDGVQIMGQSFDVRVQSTNPLQFTVVPVASAQLAGNMTPPSGSILRAKSGRLDWFGNTDQVVVSNRLSNSPPAYIVRVFTLDSELNFSLRGTMSNSAKILDLALGNYAQVLGQNDPPNLQIAVLGADSSGDGSVHVTIYQADPSNNFALSQVSDTQILQDLSPQEDNALLLVAGDTQGRSLLLGPPDKVTVTGHIQPDTVLGVPPMHVDWIAPAGGSAPSVLNVSVFPATFNSEYDFQDTSGDQASRKSTTSYTAAFKESSEQKISYGVPGVDSVSLTLKESASLTQQNTVDKTYNTYQGNSFKLIAQTLFDDRVAATRNQFNIYSYPVIGHCVPASGASPLDGCPAGTAPLHVQFSGPDNVAYIDLAEGAGIEWYQPVHEPGNVFSYPGSLGLLQANQPATNPLQLQSAGNDFWDSQSQERVSITWTQGGGQNVTSGSVSTHAFDTSVSVSGSTTIEGIGLSGSLSFDYNQSDSVSTQNTSASTYSESTGVIVNRGIPGGPTSADEYLYQVQSFIFGQTAPTGTIDTLQTNTNVQAQGFLAVGFAADPLSTGAIQSGDWWKQAYAAAPDVALNHPQRWLQRLPIGTTPQTVWFNCPVGFTSSQTSPACTPTQQTPTPANVADAPFYQMKGLFVTPGTTPGGPQITSTTQGQTVTLQARVYNYSLTNMPQGTTVRVQFYAQPWDATHGHFQGQPGNPDAFAPAVLIGEDQPDHGLLSLAPIPAFCGGSQGDVDPCTEEQPPQNWVFAQTSWDTGTVAADTDWKFWVVAWMEQGGQLVQEIHDHGLSAIPASPLNSLADVPIETYSNNLGFYNQTFHVASATSAAQSKAKAPEEGATRGGALAIDHVAIPSGSVLLHQPVMIRASHRSEGRRFDSLLTLFYDGNPEEGGSLFDQEIIPRINDSFVAPALYRPGTCGPHQIFVRAIPTDGTAEPATGMATVQVTADLVAEFASLARAINAVDLPRRIEKSLLAKVKAARKALQKGRTEAARHLLEALRHEIGALRGKKIPQKTAADWVEEVDLILGCII